LCAATRSSSFSALSMPAACLSARVIRPGLLGLPGDLRMECGPSVELWGLSAGSVDDADASGGFFCHQNLPRTSPSSSGLRWDGETRGQGGWGERVGGGSARRNGPRFSSKNGVGRGVDAGLVDAGGRAPRLLVAEMGYPLRELRRTRHRARYAVSAVLRVDAGARDEPNFVTGDRITPSKRSTVDEK